MRVKQFVICAGMLLVSSVSMAKICKTVGPDGSVVYTDRPTASCNTEPEAATEKVVAPREVPVTAEPQPTTSVSSTKRATRAESEIVPAPTALDPAIEKAVIGVLGLQDMVERTRSFCVKVLPTSARRYDAAADSWQQRNAGTVAKARRALAQTFVPQQQQLISQGVQQRNQQSLERVVVAPKASQIKWCDESADEVEARALDPQANLTAPLVPF